MNPEKLDAIMGVVCDICHYPYAEVDQEDLDCRCETCPAERALKDLL